LQEQPKIVAD